MIKKYFQIFIRVILALLAGAAVGFIFFYFFKDISVFIIDKFRILQGVFGIYQYQEGMSLGYVFTVIFFGNLLSALGYFTLGFLKASLPVSFITGVFMIIFLFTGTIRHGTSIPLEVVLLSLMEVFYRVLALTTGEYINKNRFRNKSIPVASIAIIFIMFLAAVFYEIYQIF